MDNKSLDEIEKSRSKVEGPYVDFYTYAVDNVEKLRKDYDSKINVVKWDQMPMERSPDGLIKHIIHEKMDTKEMCLDIYMQFIDPGKASGKHRHLSEEVFFVVEGEGYDLHWDVRFDCDHEMEFTWETEPKRFNWKRGDFVYIPPYCTHQHFNASKNEEARIIVINSRILRKMGFDWHEQLERAEGF